MTPSFASMWTTNLRNRLIGWSIGKDQLEEVARVSGVLQAPFDHLTEEDRAKFEAILDDPSRNVEAADCASAYIFIKDKLAKD